MKTVEPVLPFDYTGKVILTFACVNEIQTIDYSLKCYTDYYFTLQSRGTVNYAVQSGSITLASVGKNLKVLSRTFLWCRSV